jgi:uncharacterized membrane protein YqjE
MGESTQTAGLLVSVKRLFATALEMGQVRLALLGTEIEREKERLFEGLLWAAAALLVLGVGLVLLCGFVILLFWEGYRLSALGVLAAVFLTGAVFLLRQARHRLCSPQGLFAASTSELGKDGLALRPEA